MGIIEFLVRILIFLNEIIVPLILVLAFFFFIWNAARYFVIQGAEEDARKKAKRLALWGIIAFVLIVSIWGIVNMLTQGLRFDRETSITPDYVEERGGFSESDASGFSCTGSFLGFRLCGSNEPDIQTRDGFRSNDIIDPNPPPRTIRFDI